MKNKFLKNSLLSAIIVSFFFASAIFAILPQKAEAVLGVGDVVTDPAHTTVTITNWAKNFAEKAIDFSRKMAYVLLKRVVLDRMVDALIQWINRGGEGAVIENWDQFIQESADRAAGEFAQGLGAGFLCSNFGLNTQFVLLPVDKFSKITCTLDQIIGNINNFTADFRNGGWLAYQETWQPRNNFYGATLIAIDEAKSGEARAKDAAQSRGIAGQGFKAQQKCDLFASSSGNLDGSGNPIGPNYTGTRFKRECRDLTPGGLLANAAEKVLVDTPLTRIIHAEDLTSYLTAIVDASINQLSKAATEGLRGLVSKNTSNLKANPVFPCAGLTGDSFRACINSANAEKSYFQAVQGITRDATLSSLDARTEIASTLNQAINLQTSYVESLAKLVAASKTEKTQELANEQAILDVLNDRFESNQIILEALTSQNNKISGIELSNSVTPEDWVRLGGAANTQFIGDFTDAESELTAAQDELKTIQNKVNAQ